MLGLFSFFACEKESPTAILKDNVSPNVLNNLTTNNFVLTLDNAANNFEAFTWTAPDFGFQSAIRYTLQADKAGNNFADAFDVLSTEGVITGSITNGSLNKKLLDAGFEYDVAQNLEFRIAAVINSKVDTVFSNIVTANVTPYATTFPPIYMIGDGTSAGWDLSKAVEMRSTAPSVYFAIDSFTNGKIFRFFAEPSWSATQYSYNDFTTIDSDLSSAGGGDDNFGVAGATGFYAITVDLKNKTIVMVPVAKPSMYMIGGAVGGWSWGVNDIKMTWLKHGVFEATCTFSNDIFRFFDQPDWGATQYKYDYFPAGNVSTLLQLNAGDNDKNFRFIGTPGSFKITLNLLDLTVTMGTAK